MQKTLASVMKSEYPVEKENTKVLNKEYLLNNPNITLKLCRIRETSQCCTFVSSFMLSRSFIMTRGWSFRIKSCYFPKNDTTFICRTRKYGIFIETETVNVSNDTVRRTLRCSSRIDDLAVVVDVFEFMWRKVGEFTNLLHLYEFQKMQNVDIEFALLHLFLCYDLENLAKSTKWFSDVCSFYLKRRKAYQTYDMIYTTW